MLIGRGVHEAFHPRAPGAQEAAVLKRKSCAALEVVEGIVWMAGFVQRADERIAIALGLDAVRSHLPVHAGQLRIVVSHSTGGQAGP